MNEQIGQCESKYATTALTPNASDACGEPVRTWWACPTWQTCPRQSMATPLGSEQQPGPE
mgnify:CR=1 FL=1